MPVYLCRWPDGDCTFVLATTKNRAIARLDEIGNADGCQIRPITEMLIALTLTDEGRLEIDHDCDDGEPVQARGPAGDLNEVEYPILDQVLTDLAFETDGESDPFTPEQLARRAEAIACERTRVERGPSPRAKTRGGRFIQEMFDMPAGLSDSLSREGRRSSRLQRQREGRTK
jgi:hypothetical protein